jgi:bifunctional DNase/RNase
MDQVKEIEMFVAGLVLDPSSNAPIVILKDETGERALPIWIGLAEATAIASALKNVPITRPMTHDLLRNIIEEFGGRVNKILIRGLTENTFLASIEIVSGETVKTVDSRPSDALALAVRVDAPIFVNEEVLSQAQVKLVTVSPEEEMVQDTLDSFNDEQSGGSANFANIDKEQWAEILAEMDPDDFKYKM